MSDFDDAMGYLFRCVGAPYVWWNWSDPDIPVRSPAWAENAPAPYASEVVNEGCFCAGVPNLFYRFLIWLGYDVEIPGYYAGDENWDGGVLAYQNNLWAASEWFDPNADYPDCTLLLKEYVEGYSQGHVAIVYEGKIIDSTDSGGGWPGVAYGKSVPESNAWIDGYTVAVRPEAWLPALPQTPEVPIQPPSEPSTYPGDTAAPEAVAAWMAHVAEQDYGLPGILPVMCSCVELTQAWTGPGDVKDVPGYLYNVDYDSLGYFQQRPSQGWGTVEEVTDATYALNKFCEAASQYIGWFGDTPEALGAWCQKVQVSAEPEKYAAKGYPMAVALLKDAPLPETPEKEAELAWSKYTFAANDPLSLDLANAAVLVLASVGVDAMAVKGGANIAALGETARAINDISVINCVAVGRGAYDALSDEAKARWGWTSDTPIWSISGESDLVTLKKIIDWCLRWLAREEKVDEDKVVETFEAELTTLNSEVYPDLLGKLVDPELPEPPQPPPVLMTLEERVAALEEWRYSMEGSK